MDHSKNPDIEFYPEKNIMPDRLESELNKNDPQYSLGQEETIYYNRNKNYPPFMGRKRRDQQIPIRDLDQP